MYGTATSDTVLARRTGSFQFADFAGTTPTVSDGQIASSFVFAPININFTTRTGDVSSVTMQSQSATWSCSRMPLARTFGSGFVGFGCNIIGAGTCAGGGSVCGSTPEQITRAPKLRAYFFWWFRAVSEADLSR